MDAVDLILMTAVILALAALGLWMCLRMAKKAGIKPGMGYYKKLLYDNCTFTHDSRTDRHHRSCWRSRKGGRRSVEITCTRGTLLLDFYTEDGQVLQSWRNGDPAVITVELPPDKRVYRRMRMEHFSGSIAFLRRQPTVA